MRNERGFRAVSEAKRGKPLHPDFKKKQDFKESIKHNGCSQRMTAFLLQKKGVNYMSGIIFSQASGLNDSVFGKSQEPIKSMITAGVESFEETSLLSKIFYMDKTKNFAEKYATMTSLGNFQDVGENGPTPQDGFQEGFCKVIEPSTWKLGFSITAEMMEDNKIGDISNAAKRFTTSYGRTREQFGAALLSNGHNAKMKWGKKEYSITCADGKPFFFKEHPSKVDGVSLKQSNLFKGAFSVLTLDAVQEAMQDFKDDKGNLLNVKPDTIIIPNSGPLKRAVLAAVGSELDPRSNNNAWNFQCGLWNVLVWAELPKTIGGEPYFILMDSDYMQQYECMPWLDRIKLKVDSYIDHNTDANVFKGRSRFAAGFNNWRGAALCGAGLTGGTDLTTLNA